MNILFASAVIALSLGLSPSSVQAIESDELVRASIIEKISRFIEWPTWQNDHFTLCVHEKSTLLPAIQSYYETVTLVNKPVFLMIFKQPGTLQKCQALFIGEEQNDMIPELVKSLQSAPVLVVAESKGAVEMGVHVDFYNEDNRLHLEVNKKSMDTSGFKVSFHLLKVANIVQ